MCEQTLAHLYLLLKLMVIDLAHSQEWVISERIFFFFLLVCFPQPPPVVLRFPILLGSSNLCGIKLPFLGLHTIQYDEIYHIVVQWIQIELVWTRKPWYSLRWSHYHPETSTISWSSDLPLQYLHWQFILNVNWDFFFLFYTKLSRNTSTTTCKKWTFFLLWHLPWVTGGKWAGVRIPWKHNLCRIDAFRQIGDCHGESTQVSKSIVPELISARFRTIK